jgi:serine/threonine-protein kinase
VRSTFAGRATILLGRAPEAQICLAADESASRRHALVEFDPPRCVVRDLGSHNGMRHNGVRLEGEAPLRDGDRLAIGQSVFDVHLQGGGAGILGGALAPAGERAEEPPRLDLPGLELLRLLGEGGVGRVYLARRRADGQSVAVKVLRPEYAVTEEDVATFAREARLGAQLRHPHAVEVFDAGFASGAFYFELEYVDGPDAAAVIAARGPFSVGAAIAVARQVLCALAAAHARHLVHRDVKPENILLDGFARAGRDEGVGRLHAKLTDFGLMRCFDDPAVTFITRTGEGKGTPAFMPPEQIEGARRAGPAADIYALGGTLYYLLTGATPLDFATVTHPLITILEAPPVPLRTRLPEAPAALEALIARCLAKDPRERPEGAGALAAALAELA